ncbi:MAG: SDR family oxidoreductase [Acidimicrobiia bacterium]|jgi:NAD(P)-dependent dehydrogenase (short-subunit alcohol dehydrogenase family)|nr:SDR family oxidoreductase [Acidimicrobiia bacterium]
MRTIALFGGTGGLGSQLQELLKEKYNVISIGSKTVNVVDYNQVNEFFNQNKVDIVINLSGYNFDCFAHKYTESNYSEIQKQIDINVKGTINIVSSCLNHMRSQNYGRIILASSILAAQPVISTSVYSGCKGFIDSYVRTISIENAAKDVTCNSLQLGYFDGGLTYKIKEDFREGIKNTIPVKRWGTIQELYNTVEYLIQTGYVTGQNIKIAGGII